MFGVVLGCAWSFGLFYVDFGSKTELGLLQVVSSSSWLVIFALSCVLFF